ncbi:hypothetical protein LTR53_005803 [Teratosphaeriaceae sp. CCFEE 6253]|nr:hypothetical protein LTR53_005803 [Teratosphaeriaceae sp. CCFEE 6253]
MTDRTTTTPRVAPRDTKKPAGTRMRDGAPRATVAGAENKRPAITTKPPARPTRTTTSKAPIPTRSAPAKPANASSKAAIPPVAEISDERPPPPPKLEIRSATAPDALKPQAQSDNEQGGCPRLLRGHSRTQSAIIPSRPMTAPDSTTNDQQQGLREMEIMQNLLRESMKRDTMAVEIKDLQAENEKLRRQNAKLVNATKSAPKPLTLAEAAKERALKVMLTSQHTAAMDEVRAAHRIAVTGMEESQVKQLQTLRTELESQCQPAVDMDAVNVTHQAVVTALEEKHAFQLQNLRSELETQRRQSSKLETVETKIIAVEDALKQSKKRASQNEQEFQQSVQEKNKLGRVIADLRKEITRCQKKLNEDVAQQLKEKKEAQRAQEQLSKDLEEERARNKVAAEKRAKERKAEASESASRKTLAQNMERLRRAASDAETAKEETMELLKAESQSCQALALDVEQLQQAAAETAIAGAKAVELLEAECRLREMMEHQLEHLKQAHAEAEAAEKETQSKILAQKDAGAAQLGEVIERLQNQVTGLELQLQDAVASEDRNADALAQKDADAQQLRNVIEQLQDHVKGLQQQLNDAESSKDERTSQYKEAIATLEMEAETLQKRAEEQAGARESKITELNDVVAELQGRIEQDRQAAEDPNVRAEQDREFNMVLVERLQTEIQASHHELHDERTAHGISDIILRSAQAAYEASRTEADELKSSRAEMERMLAQAKAAKSAAESARDEASEELKMSQRMFQDSQQVGEDKGRVLERLDREHADALERQKCELEEAHEGTMESLRATQSSDEASASAGRNKDLVEEHVAAMARLQESHADELSSVLETQQRDGAERQAAALASLEERAAEALESEKRGLTARHDAALASLKEDHASGLASALEKQKRNISERQKTTLASLEEQVAEALEKEKSELVDRLTGEHAAALASVKTSHEDELANLRHEAEVDRDAMGLVQQLLRTAEMEKDDVNMRLALSPSWQEAKNAEEKRRELTDHHEAALVSLTGSHARELAGLQQAAAIDREAIGLAQQLLRAAEAEKDGLAMVLAQVAGQEDRNVTEEDVKESVPYQQLLEEFEAYKRQHASTEPEQTKEVKSLKPASPRLPETPLAYASDDEPRCLPSPTPAYPKDGQRAGALIELAQQDENSPPKGAEELAHAEKSDSDDPFAPRSASVPVPTTPLQKAAGHCPASEQGWHGNSPMTLEGTLESIRVQTEQLLEINDDFLAEQRRWSRRLGLQKRRSRGSGAGSPRVVEGLV